MPAPIADWSEVKATAISTGNLQRAAELHGLPYDAVRQRSSREKWPVGFRVHKAVTEAKAAVTAQIQASTEGRVTVVTAAEAIAEENANNSRRSRAAALRYSARTLEHAADLDPETALASASDVSSVVKVASVAGGWAAPASGSVTISLLSAVSVQVGTSQDCESTVEQIES